MTRLERKLTEEYHCWFRTRSYLYYRQVYDDDEEDDDDDDDDDETIDDMTV